MKNKRGIVEIQLNWVFILAVGAFILLFFSVILLKQKSISETSTSSLILRNLEGILSGAEVSLGTVNTVSIPVTKMEFECNRYRIGGVSRQFEVMSIFTPSRMETNKLITWTLDWSLPYRVTNLLYLTSPKIRYIFVVEPDCILPENICFGKEIYNSTPDEIRKEIIDIGDIDSISDEGDKQVRMVFFDPPNIAASIVSIHQSMKKSAVSILKVDGDEDSGSLNFYNFEGGSFVEKGTAYYIRKPALMGAIFSDDIDVYNCVMNNAFRKLGIVSQIYAAKTSDLNDYYLSQSSPCSIPHFQALNEINTIKIQSENTINRDIGAINIAASTLEQKNKNAQLLSCALIY